MENKEVEQTTVEENQGSCTEPRKDDERSSELHTCDVRNNVADHMRVNVHGRVSGPARRSSKGNWTEEEDNILRDAVHRFDAKCLRDRTDVQCLHRWRKVLDPELNKGPWSKEEDDLIIDLAGKQGSNKKWTEIAKHLPGRIGKQCRERWCNHLNPEINKSAWTREEENILINAHAEYGNKWAEISKFLPGRTENSIKNHWNCSLKKKCENYMAFGLNNPKFSVPALPGNRKEMGCTKPMVTTQYPVVGNIFRDPSNPNWVHNNKKTLTSNYQSCAKEKSATVTDGNENYLITPPPLSCNLIQLFNDDRNGKILQASSLDRSPGRDCGNIYPECYRNISSGISWISPTQEGNKCDRFAKQEENVYTGLCYEPLQDDDVQIFLSTGSFPSSDNYIRLQKTLVSSTSPKGHVGALCVSSSSPESILKSVAENYDKKPSIFRKSAVRNSQRDRCANPCSPDESTNCSNIRSLASHESLKVRGPQIQRSCQSLPSSLKFENCAATKIVGKCLENEFDIVWDRAKVKTRNSVSDADNVDGYS